MRFVDLPGSSHSVTEILGPFATGALVLADGETRSKGIHLEYWNPNSTEEYENAYNLNEPAATKRNCHGYRAAQAGQQYDVNLRHIFIGNPIIAEKARA